MALIYRSLVQVSDADLVERLPAVFNDWASFKVRASVNVSEDGSAERDGTHFEFGSTADADDGIAALRMHLYEDRGEEQVRLTMTALADGAERWLWTDIERWTEAAFDPGWIPYAPGVATSALEAFDASVGGMRLSSRHDTYERDAVDRLLAVLFDPVRSVPLVVVSPTREEREDDIQPCAERARQLQRRLTGVAQVVTLGPGATSALSKGLGDALGPDWDVHSGAVRTYLPGLGSHRDMRRRHRFVPFHRLHGRPADTAARLISVPLVQASCLQPPPPGWRERARQLPAFAGTTVDGDLDAILESAEAERDAARAAQEAAELRQAEDRETVDEVMGQLERLTGRVAYLEGELAKKDPTVLHAQLAEDVFEPEWCEEVAIEAMDRLPDVVIEGEVVHAAGGLDVHNDCSSWARKAWRSLRALQAYADVKRAGDGQGWDFKRFCEQSGHAAVIPVSWVAPESETTKKNKTFRALRTLPVPSEVAAEGRVFMPAHIRIEKGGSPCPRIHFHDDTDGTTGKVYVGWFGDHLDSSAKS